MNSRRRPSPVDCRKTCAQPHLDAMLPQPIPPFLRVSVLLGQRSARTFPSGPPHAASPAETSRPVQHHHSSATEHGNESPSVAALQMQRRMVPACARSHSASMKSTANPSAKVLRPERGRGSPAKGLASGKACCGYVGSPIRLRNRCHPHSRSHRDDFPALRSGERRFSRSSFATPRLS